MPHGTVAGMDVKAARESKGVSQSDLARKLGVLPVTVWRWEAGKKKPNAANQLAIAQALGMSVEELAAMPEPDRRSGLVPDRPAPNPPPPPLPARTPEGETVVEG
jgi:transcriptional regulator with XRE-family HTH domain